MTTSTRSRPWKYRPTAAKDKGGARDVFVAYDIEQRTRSGSTAIYPKVKRVYIAGEVKDWKAGNFHKRSGREVHGVRIEYERTRRGYDRSGYLAHRGNAEYGVPPGHVPPTHQRFAKIIELPAKARSAHFYYGLESLPERYRHALQHVR
jgi:hypothetical protein